MALSTEDAAALVSLRAAYRALIAGDKVAKVTAFGRTVEYAQGDTRRLQGEIERLEALESASGRKRGAFRFQVR